jgi:hypothetical protein
MKVRAKALSTGLAFGALIALGAMLAGGTAASAGSVADAAKIKNCTEATNIEAIIDDSGSMSFSDPSKLRNSLLDTLVGLPENKGKQMGAVEFASSATVLFSPIPIGSSSAQATVGSFLGLINDDGSQAAGDSGGTTNYNAGFTAGNSANPTADARIFLSDGAPNAGGDPAAHRTPPTKTYVVGFDAAVTTPSLAQIAAETGGQVFAVTTSAEILPIAGEISALLNCKSVRTFVDTFLNQGQSESHKFKATGKNAQILTTWPAQLTNISLNVNEVGGGGAGKAVATVAKVKGSKSKGANFAAIKAKGLKKGKKYKIKIKAKLLPVPGTVVTTQVIK